MKKKLLALLISIITAVLVFTGCASTNPLTGIEGTPIGNGTFLVEKGNYVYFVNGQESTTADNTFNTPVKASLVRVKKSELASQTKSEPEIVVPKIIMTGTYNVGVYFFGNSVYYATPCTNKDKTGTIQNQKTEFISLNLKTGKQGKSIAISDTNTCEFRYVEVGDKVYLLYTFSEVVDNVTQNKFKVVDASNGKDVYVSPAYANVAFPDDSSLTVFYSKVAFSESLDQDTAFNDLYSYKVGDTEDKLAIAGAGYYETTRNEVYKTAQKFIGINGEVINGIEGVTITLIKNTGKYVILKATTLDSTYTSNIYFGAEIDNGAIKAGTIKCLGHSNVITDNAITATSYYESLEEIYYIDKNSSGSTTRGLMKYNYTYIYNNPNDGLLGSSIISADAKNLAICFVEGNYMYLCNTAEGIYYRANYKDADVKVKQINGVKMQTSTDYYMPRVVGNYFIGSYSSEPFFKYIFVVDMTDIDNDEAYEKYLEDVAVKDAETIYNLSKTMIGKMNETDAKAFETYFETNYPNFDLEEQE